MMIEDNQIKPAAFSSHGDWATEYEQQHRGGQPWADQFVNQQASTSLIKISVASFWIFFVDFVSFMIQYG